MSQKIRDLMTKKLVTLQPEATLVDAARKMKENDIGSVLLTNSDGKLAGLLTDRDIVVRALAEGKDVRSTRVQDVVSSNPQTLAPDDGVDRAVTLMREKSVRRLPVVEAGRPVGVVSLGDLAQIRSPHSPLGQISSATPNR